MTPDPKTPDEAKDAAQASLARPSCSANWWVVLRTVHSGERTPIAAFFTEQAALEWIGDAAHRKNDILKQMSIHFDSPNDQGEARRSNEQ